jgi:hypothetical protein
MQLVCSAIATGLQIYIAIAIGLQNEQTNRLIWGFCGIESSKNKECELRFYTSAYRLDFFRCGNTQD